ncbi:hypothetical protein F4813DRAFT_40233 [Daldinia decipiens]|uniref:uncharacterized protein n=1 Tax=Daldinia decipiens TaxID=326647 RepID=UPI0020C37613|nr:uncharacterized protein F4813DRAFT_40233 [Daldinia decipiens]KAI1658633.1 hypothetical protein F4813DRAFT_40233 [Daldinia decipiens]
MSILTRAIFSSLTLSRALATDSAQIRDIQDCPGVRVVDAGYSGCCGPTTTTQTTTPLSCATFVNDGTSYTEVIASISRNLQAIITSFGTTLDSQAIPTVTSSGEVSSKTSEGAAADSVPRMGLAGGGILAAAAAALI